MGRRFRLRCQFLCILITKYFCIQIGLFLHCRISVAVGPGPSVILNHPNSVGVVSCRVNPRRTARTQRIQTRAPMRRVASTSSRCSECWASAHWRWFRISRPLRASPAPPTARCRARCAESSARRAVRVPRGRRVLPVKRARMALPVRTVQMVSPARRVPRPVVVTAETAAMALRALMVWPAGRARMARQVRQVRRVQLARRVSQRRMSPCPFQLLAR